ncbi:signal peptidase I [Haloferula helveola]|uniref:Signal peptidase I n=1 Tax=Haloferula helveola TaxID=490095 RepID=A0ABM7RDX0_9BACT|nr:signal peptidase I [Haloferula helveola]
MFDFLKPRWKKDAKHLLKGAKKFIHYKRDLLADDRIDEIESRRVDLREAMKSNDRKLVEEAGKQLRATCEQALPRAPKQTWWEENVEVLFVALVIALGLRAYVLQPFRIPTGSMQPTLNGITVVRAPDSFEKPWIGQRAFEWLWRGRTYKTYVAENDMKLVPQRNGHAGRPASWFLFTRTAFDFSDGTTIKVPAESNEAGNIFKGSDTPGQYKAGETIFNGWIDTGDLVLVDKISYHFRKPKRGEVFVFDTRGIPTRGESRGPMADQSGGSHYIKRLCGVPGDELQIDAPELWVNGKIADEPGIVRVMKHEGEYAAYANGEPRPGYILGDLRPGGMAVAYSKAPLVKEGDVFKLKDSEQVGMRQYAALGDNTANSLDSRYWGPVHEFNLAGPGWFSLWPFGSGHWGFIR